MAGMRVGALFFANNDASLQFSEADFIELIKVIGIDPQETHPFNQRVRFVRRFLKHAFIER
ncbi:Uncharacterised protein [Shigella sonnei]|nr:Uncharacterised protein [Shigella sonnei]CSP95298.1 Uncharacterised protein [Shigella sonnei]CSR95612.1 Uncharacterised protein [Shigella sonnei]